MSLWDRIRKWLTGDEPAGEDLTPKPPKPRIPPPPQRPPSVPPVPQIPRRAGGDQWQPIDTWNVTRRDLWSSMRNPDVLNDPMAQSLFEGGYLDRTVGGNMRKYYRDSLNQYLRSQYGIEFRTRFDWDSWREEYADIE